jgi:hypothetical protein
MVNTTKGHSMKSTKLASGSPIVFPYGSYAVEGQESRTAHALHRTPRLISWLYQTAAIRNESLLDLAHKLQVSDVYLAQLASGQRSTAEATPDFYRAAGRYIGIPAVVAMVSANRIRASDFLMPEAGLSQAMQLNAGLDRIAADTLLGGLMPQEAWDVPDTVKAMLIALYEDATHQDLSPQRQLPALIRALQDATDHLEDTETAEGASIDAGQAAKEHAVHA